MSLIEVSMVLLLMVLFMGMALPRFSLLFQGPLEKDGQKIQLLISRLKKEALLGGSGFKLVFDSPKREVRLYQQDGADPEAYHPYESKGLRGFTLSDGVQMKPVVKRQDKQFQMGFQSLDFDPIFGLESEIFIDHSGLTDLFSLQLYREGNRMVVEVDNIMGEPKLIRLNQGQ